jgi:hypothetical protein
MYDLTMSFSRQLNDAETTMIKWVNEIGELKGKIIELKKQNEVWKNEVEVRYEQGHEKQKICALCKNKWDCEYGNNGKPVCDGRVCNECDKNVIIPFRIKNLKQ